MQQGFLGAVTRLHGPLNLRLWDTLMGLVATGFVAASLPLVMLGEPVRATVCAVGGAVLFVRLRMDQRSHERSVWLLASEADDPVETLALYEYLYRLRFRDLAVLSRWRAERERAGLPVICNDPDAPPQVLAVYRHLRGHPIESGP